MTTALRNEGTPITEQEYVRVCRVPFDKTLIYLFPEIEGTGIALSASHLVSSIQPYCFDNPINHSQTPHSFAMIRGSAMKRVYMGTPPGYWDVSRLYQTQPTSLLDPNSRYVIDKVAEGPRDIDIRFVKLPWITNNQIVGSFIETLTQEGYKIDPSTNHLVKDGVCVTITEKKVGKNGAGRSLFHVRYMRAGKTLLHLDIGELPYQKNTQSKLCEDNRLHELMPAYDWLLTGSLGMNAADGVFIDFQVLDIDTDLRRILSQGLYLHPNDLWYPDFIQGFASLFSTSVFWPDLNPLDTLIDLRMRVVELETYANKQWGREVPHSLDVLRERGNDLTARLLAPLTYNLPLAWTLLFQSYFANTLPIGKKMQEAAQKRCIHPNTLFIECTKALLEEIDPYGKFNPQTKEYYLYDLPYLGSLYLCMLQSASSLIGLGIDLLAKSLIKTGVVKPEEVSTIEQKLALINPFCIFES